MQIKTQQNLKTPKKIIRLFVATLTVVIFISGASTAVYKLLNKEQKLSQTHETTSELPGWWLHKYFGSSICEKEICKPLSDPDLDKLTNQQEYFYHTNPLSAFTVSDTLNDGELLAMGFDPSRPGRLTFDQVISDENILSESLLLDVDIKKMIAQDLNIDNVKLNLAKDEELKIFTATTKAEYEQYFEQMTTTIEKYFPQQRLDSVVKVLETGDEFAVEDIKNKTTRVAVELKKIPVPSQLLIFHKYNLALYEVVPKVLVSNYASLSGQALDVWFDNVQTMLALMQKLNFETARLSTSP